MNKKSLLFFLCLPIYASATVIWHNIMDPGTANATDEDVQINGDTWLPAETILVQALTRDITINMLNGPHVIHGSKDGDDNVTIIQLIAQFPWKIEIIVSEDLRFVGTPNNLAFPIIIEERHNTGANDLSIIQWTIAKDKHLYFGPRDSDQDGGAELKIVCNQYNAMPKHIFKVNGPKEKPQIFFGRNSSLTILYEVFIEPFSFQQSLLFDSSNGQPRSHLVNFKDGSGLYFEAVELTT